MRSSAGDTDLGTTLEGMRAFAELGRLEPGGEFGALYSVALAGDEDVPADQVREVAAQAQVFRDRHGDRLSDHARWMLDQLARAAAPVAR